MPFSKSSSDSFLEIYPLSAKKLSEKVFCKVSNNILVTVIGIAWRQAETQYFPAVIDDKMEFEAVKPSSGTFPPLCKAVKDLVLLDPMAVAHIQCCRVHKAYPGTR